MTIGIWRKNRGTRVTTPHTVNDLIDNLDAVRKLATALHSVWMEGGLHINFSEKTFKGHNLNPLVVQGLINIGFTRV